LPRKEKKADGKYSTKTPKMAFLHKYTGAIILGIIAISVIIIWGVVESDKVFFENWSCNAVLDIEIEGMTTKELLRHSEIVSECDQFTPP
jgi:hypothetical protein